MPLSFFTNSGNSYGSAIPFQRMVEPAQLGFFLNLEQAELLRIQRYNEAWRFYYGKHWIFDREDGEPLVTINYFRKIIDKSVAFLCSKGFNITVPECLEEITKPFLDEVWDYNGRDQKAVEIGTMGSVTGDAFILVTYEEPSEMQRRINPYSQGKIRINLLGSEQVYPTWDPLNTETLTAVRIETIYYAERGTRQLDRDDRTNHEGRQLYTKRFTQIVTPTQIVEQYHGERPVIKPNILGEIPLVHIRNLPVPKEYYGLPDGQDLVDLQRELNEKCTDISDTINYHSAPITVITGAKAKQLERGPRQIWSGLPSDARVSNLELGGDLVAANNYRDFIKKAIHEISDTPEGTLGERQPISNTSGVALHMSWQPLIEKTRRKKIQYQPGFEQVNYFILRIGMVTGLINLPFDLDRNSGGRIVEIETDETAPVWNPETEQYEDRPIRRKEAFHIDKQTLEFTDPNKMRMKFWRQYGFGGEIREMPINEIFQELATGRPSFWDFAFEENAEVQAWEEEVQAIRERNRAAREEAANAPPPEQPLAQMEGEGAGAGGMEWQQPPQAPPPPQEESEPPRPQPKIKQLPLGEVEVPEEPKWVTVVTRLYHPETGAQVGERKERKFLVPVNKINPQYLSPFQNKVEFNDVLPKDEALQAQLYQTYQQNGWVDEEWVRDRIPEIKPHAVAIKKRLGVKTTSGLPHQSPQGLMPGPQPGVRLTEMAPKMPPAGQVPGPGGNPVPPGQGAT